MVTLKTKDENDTKINIVKTIGDVKRIGDSFYIHLDKNIRRHLHIDKDVVLGMKLWNIETKNVKCQKCGYEFVDYAKSDPHDCPNCGIEILDVNCIEAKEEEPNDQSKPN